MTEVLPLNTTPLPLKLRIADYLQLDGSGAFADYAKTELIEGEIFFMNAQHRPHALLKSRLYLAIAEALKLADSPLTALVEASIAIPDHSVPEPDIVLTSEPEGEGLIPLASVALIVEVADTSLAHDLRRKAALYAAAGISEYWVADVGAGVIHQMWQPEAGAYTQRREISRGEPIEVTTLPGLTLNPL